MTRPGPDKLPASAEDEQAGNDTAAGDHTATDTGDTSDEDSDDASIDSAVQFGDGDVAQGQDSDIDTGNDGQDGSGDAGGLPVGTPLSRADQIDLTRLRVGEDGPPGIDPDGGSFQNSTLPGRDPGALGDGLVGVRAPKAETDLEEGAAEFGKGAGLGEFGRGAAPADGRADEPSDLEAIAGRSLDFEPVDADKFDADQGEPTTLGDIFAGLRTAPGHGGADAKSDSDDGFDVG
jgi:hypothetical protein